MVKGYVDKGMWGPIDPGESIEVYGEKTFNDLSVVILEAEEVEELKDLIRSLRVLVDPSDEYYAEEALAILEGGK